MLYLYIFQLQCFQDFVMTSHSTEDVSPPVDEGLLVQRETQKPSDSAHRDDDSSEAHVAQNSKKTSHSTEDVTPPVDEGLLVSAS